MNEKEYLEKKLFVPQGMKAEREYFQGFGRDEMIRAGYALLVLCIVAAMIYIVFHRSIYVLGILISGGISIVAMITRSEITNISAWDQVVDYVRYLKEQQEYYYKQVKEDER